MTRFQTVAMGGTFDVIHAGHIALLNAAFSVSSNVIIGLSGDSLVSKKGKKLWHTYQQRLDALKSFLEKKFPEKSYVISPLDNDFGPAVLEKQVEALVVSEETSPQGERLNRMRKERGMPPVHVIVVPMVLASDGSRISSTRIRNSEIDPSGKLL
ncbi:MAG: pantetheine-phosphate adenylyltransferase [Candidatus Nitrosotenuis sp.]|nr:MAG: pantetheine-phosphate adenylyltransferase [Candidatus Nitrosotenuis sp.]